MSAIGPGDWVECICNQREGKAPTKLIVGRHYRVEAVGVCPANDVNPFHPWIRVVGCPPRKKKLGYRLEWFRPVRAASDDLIHSLKQPAPDAVRELITAD
jgi:hypothetical protein